MSNNQRISVPEGFMLVERSIWTEQQVEAATECITRLKGVVGMRDRDLAIAAIDAAQCKAPEIYLADLLPAEKHQGEPVHMVRSHGSCCWEEASGEGLDICLSMPEEYEVRKLYTHADPDEAERLHKGHIKALEALNEQSEKQRDHWMDECKTLRTQLQLMTGDYRTAIVNGHERITFLGGDCDSVDRMLADNPNYANARALLNRKP